MNIHPKRVGMVFLLGWVVGISSSIVADAASRSEAEAPVKREERKPSASETSPRFVEPAQVKVERAECQVGEERNASGDCVRPYTFDRPFRRGGR